MIRALPQSALCILVAPLLAAQQVAGPHGIQSNATPAIPRVMIPKDQHFPLVALETVSSATAKKGDSVRFAVTKSFVLDGVTVIPAGMPVMGSVVKVKHGVPGHREGYLKVHLKSIEVGRDTIPITSSDPRYRMSGREAFHEHARDILDNVGGAVFCAALLPICIALEVSVSDNGKPDGKDAVLPTCFPTDAWTASATSVQTANVTGADSAQNEGAHWMPQTCIDRFEIDWAVSGGEMVLIE